MDDKNQSDCCKLQSLYLDPSVWRQGYGKAMVNRVMTYAQERGFVEVAFWVLDTNNQAGAFYESLGFVADGALKHLETDGWRGCERSYAKSCLD